MCHHLSSGELFDLAKNSELEFCKASRNTHKPFSKDLNWETRKTYVLEALVVITFCVPIRRFPSFAISGRISLHVIEILVKFGPDVTLCTKCSLLPTPTD